MKTILFLLFILIGIGVDISAQNIVKLEYSIDEFVAEGKGTVLNVPGNSNMLDATYNIDISGLNPGVHTLYIRALTNNGSWSVPVEKTFYIPLPKMLEGITEIEYSMDGFAKEGDGDKIQVQKKTSHLDSTFNIDIVNLSEGPHTFYVRAKNKFGVWSIPLERSFVKSNPNTTKVKDIYYRIYSERYEGAWMNSTVNPQQKLVDSTIFIPVAGLDFNKTYSIEFYAKNTVNNRGFSTYLNNLALSTNSAPTNLKESLNLSMFRNEIISISMDSLFNDVDLVNGDSLMYAIINPDNQEIYNFSSWDVPSVLSVTPDNKYVGSYNYWFVASDLAGESDSVEVMLTVNNITSSHTFDKEDAPFNIYPNPAKDFVTLQILDNSISAYKLNLYNSQGQIMMNKYVAENKYVLNLKHYSQGVYIITIKTNSKFIRKRIIHN